MNKWLESEFKKETMLVVQLLIGCSIFEMI